MTEMTNSVEDVIEMSDVIQAPIGRVWRVISLPGWWLIESQAAALRAVAADVGEPVTYGRNFAVETVSWSAPNEITFRWRWLLETERPETTVQIILSELDSVTRITVRESGLSVGDNLNLLAEHYSENLAGWKEMLTQVKLASE